PTCGHDLSACGPVELFRVGRRQRLAILDTLRLYSEFVADAWHGEDECWRLRVRLDFAPQPGDEYIDVAIIGFCAMPKDGMRELVTRQYAAGTVYECGQQPNLSAGQLRFPALAIDKGVAGQVKLAAPDF